MAAICLLLHRMTLLDTITITVLAELSLNAINKKKFEKCDLHKIIFQEKVCKSKNSFQIL